MDVSVIISTRDRANALEETLQSLRKVVVPSTWAVELLLVDNASTDRTPEVIAACEHPEMIVRGLQEPRPGKSRALNRAIEASRGEVLLFTDDDVRFPSDWVERMSAPILRADADAVSGGIELASELQRPWMGSAHEKLLGSTESVPVEEGKYFFGANIAVSRRVFEKIPGYDEALGPGGDGLGGAEDALLGWQIREHGFTIMGCPDITVEHHPDVSLLSSSSFRARAESLGRSEAYISYHWEQRRWPLWKLYAGWIYYRLQLWVKHVRNRGGMFDGEGIPIEEFEVRRRLARIRQHLSERGSYPKYQQQGLIKMFSRSREV